MALTTYHHGITATETSNITPIIKSVSMSTIALVSTSVDADDTKYPLDTPVLLTGITTDDVAKAGSKDTLLSQCLQTIKSIQNTNVVVLRLSEPVDADGLDTLLSCQTRLGVTPKILIAPEIDTPDITRKLVEIAKKRRGFVYASPRNIDGSLITDLTEIAAYRDTFAARELMLIENDWGTTLQDSGSCRIAPSPWSNPITFEMVNRPTGNGGIQVMFGSPSSNGNVLSIGDWIDLSQLTTIEQFFESVNDTIRNDAPYRLGVMSQDDGAVRIRVEPAANGHLPTKGLTSVTYAAEKVGDFYTYDEQYIGTNAEAVIDLASAFTDNPILFINCEYISDLPSLPPLA